MNNANTQAQFLEMAPNVQSFVKLNELVALTQIIWMLGSRAILQIQQNCFDFLGALRSNEVLHIFAWLNDFEDFQT